MAEPTNTPVTFTCGGPEVPAESSWQFDHTSSGAVALKACQAPSTSAAAAHGQCSVNSASGRNGMGVNVNDVTMPKFPPPPPRHAQ